MCTPAWSPTPPIRRCHRRSLHPSVLLRGKRGATVVQKIPETFDASVDIASARDPSGEGSKFVFPPACISKEIKKKEKKGGGTRRKRSEKRKERGKRKKKNKTHPSVSSVKHVTLFGRLLSLLFFSFSHLFRLSRSRSFFSTLPWLIKLLSDDNKHCDVALLRVHVVILFIAKIGSPRGGWVTVDNDNVPRDCGN